MVMAYNLGGSFPGTTDCSGWQNVVNLRLNGNMSPAGRSPFQSTYGMNSQALCTASDSTMELLTQATRLE